MSELVADALAILETLEDLELDEADHEATTLLTLVAGQDVEPGDTDGSWRIARKTAPDRVISTVDPESRHAHKNRCSLPRRVDKLTHLAFEPDSGVITATNLTASSGRPERHRAARRRGPASLMLFDRHRRDTRRVEGGELLSPGPHRQHLLDERVQVIDVAGACLEVSETGVVAQPRPTRELGQRLAKSRTRTD